MDITTYLVTKNNESVVKNCLTTLQPLKSQILIADLGSTDSTVNICENFGALVYKVPNMTREHARNYLIAQSNTQWHLSMNPWETLIDGHEDLINLSKGYCYNLGIIQGDIISKEMRLWNGKKVTFINPIFEYANVTSDFFSNIFIHSTGTQNISDLYKEIENWKILEPLSPDPYYYQSCLLLSENKFDEFVKASEYYMHSGRQDSTKSNILNRYYYALVQAFHKKNAKAAVQNLIICLSIKPLMAEFWCLMGDIHYQLLNRFDKAIEFYKNALILGKYRFSRDDWPMELSKYRKHPEKMIKSCEQILKQQTFNR